jgi:hypothetical protein
VARSLKWSSTRALGLAIQDIRNPHFTECGLRVPDHVALVAYDDFEGADLFHRLTSVAQPYLEIGEHPIELPPWHVRLPAGAAPGLVRSPAERRPPLTISAVRLKE